jgi:hypothetical protein
VASGRRSREKILSKLLKTAASIISQYKAENNGSRKRRIIAATRETQRYHDSAYLVESASPAWLGVLPGGLKAACNMTLSAGGLEK